MIYAIAWFAFLVFIYIGTYLWNKHTPKPEGCEEMKECAGCANIACSHHEEKEDSR